MNATGNMTEDSLRDEAFRELVRLSEEMGLYDLKTTVCLSHLRFIPCRRHEGNTPCVLSDREEDVAHVQAYQAGEVPEEDLPDP